VSREPATAQAAAELPPGLEADFGWLLGRLLHAHVTMVKEAVADFPSGHRGYQALTVAVHESARNQVRMARMLSCDRTVMVYLIDDLVNEGLVERHPDPADRRNRLIVATDKGRQTLKAANEVIACAEERLLAALDPQEREALRSMLKRVIVDQAPDSSPCATAREVVDAVESGRC
jgi:DNA-binding MarR family transcriptional regulator